MSNPNLLAELEAAYAQGSEIRQAKDRAWVLGLWPSFEADLVKAASSGDKQLTLQIAFSSPGQHARLCACITWGYNLNAKLANGQSTDLRWERGSRHIMSITVSGWAQE